MEFLNTRWKEYEILDAGEKEKLERWDNVILRRPDPQCLWPKDESVKEWNRADAVYHRSNKGGGTWEYKKKLPEFWTIHYGEIQLKVSPTGFKHTGIFPEQAANWDWVMEKIRESGRDDITVLNLFAYTGAATVAASLAGAKEVVHVDAAKGMVQWAKENAELNHLQDRRIRFIVDDVNKFVAREARRGRKYDAIIMDPPSYGRGPNGEMWKLEEQLSDLIASCMKILSDDPLFFLVNSYTTGYTSGSLKNLMKLTLGKRYPGYRTEVGPLQLPISHDDLVLPCGITGRFAK
ncbi:MAG: class I SAM-dependent methyltransferase [Erysipelotrichales bacterium]|nr:class I SAM-dependent methyltransferase [Erysipelotrichales bacterium]